MLDSWRKDLARHQKAERTALGREHAKSAREYERGVRQTYAHDARRAVPEVLQARQSAAREREIDRRAPKGASGSGREPVKVRADTRIGGEWSGCRRTGSPGR